MESSVDSSNSYRELYQFNIVVSPACQKTLFNAHERDLFGVVSASVNVNEHWRVIDERGRGNRFARQDKRYPQSSRNQFLLSCRNCLTIGFAASTAASWSSFPEPGSAKLYSENAANMERINNGDFSGGSVFNNNPDTERGKKRRAMTGCKVTLSREEASVNILKRTKMMSEKECNTMVMDGETEFMLQALRNLDCPTCANGIGQVQ